MKRRVQFGAGDRLEFADEEKARLAFLEVSGVATVEGCAIIFTQAVVFTITFAGCGDFSPASDQACPDTSRASNHGAEPGKELRA